MAINYFFTEIVRFALGLQQFDGDVVEGAAGVGAGDVGEMAGGIAKLTVGHHNAGFGATLNGVHNVGGTEGKIKVRNVVLVEKRGGMRRDAYAEDADVIVFEDEVMAGLSFEGNGFRSLGVQRKRELEQEGTEKQFHNVTSKQLEMHNCVKNPNHFGIIPSDPSHVSTN